MCFDKADVVVFVGVVEESVTPKICMMLSKNVQMRGVIAVTVRKKMKAKNLLRTWLVIE